MKTKLTLSVDSRIIKKARRKASAKKTSISKLVEQFLENLTLDVSSRDDDSDYGQPRTDAVKAIVGDCKPFPTDYDKLKTEWHGGTKRK